MRHVIALGLLKLGRLIAILAHKIDNDLTGKFILLPAIHEYDVPESRVQVLYRDKLQPNRWVIK